MKYNKFVLSPLALALAFVTPIRLCITPDSEGHTQNPDGKSDTDHMPQAGGKPPVTIDWRAIGSRDATEIRSLENRATTFTKKVLLERAKELGGNDLIMEDYLTGFAMQYGTSGKQRKREVKAIFEAYSVQNFERVVGLTEKKVDSEGKTIEEPMPIKDTKTGKEWLEAFDGGYHELVKLASEIRGKKPGGQPSGESRAMTDGAKESISKTLRERAKPEEAASFVQDCISNMAHAKDGEKMLAIQALGIFRRLMQSGVESIRKQANECYLKTEALVNSIEKMPAAVDVKAPGEVKVETFSAPTPAETAEQKVA